MNCDARKDIRLSIKLLPGTSLKIVGFGHTDELCALHAS